MGRVYLVRDRKRSHHVESCHSHHGKTNVDVLELLQCMHRVFRHTCVHTKEDICGEECMHHLVKEVSFLLMEVKELEADIDEMEGLSDEAVDHIDESLDDMSEELDCLHSKLRMALKSKRDQGVVNWGNLQSILAGSCEKIRGLYNHLIDQMHHMHLIDNNEAAELHLS